MDRSWLFFSFSQKQFTWISKQFNFKCNKSIGKKIKLSGKGAVRTGQGMNDVIKIIKSLEDSSVLVDGITETVKHKIKKKKQEGGFLGALLVPLVVSLVWSIISS